jgi:lambda family phage portal protein
VIHLFVQEHVGQRHGISVFEPVIKRLGDIDESVEAEIIRKNVEACFAGFITPAAVGDVDDAMGDVEDQGEGRFATETLEPGMLTRLRPGEDVKFADPKGSGGLNDIVKLALFSTAAGVGITYEHLSGDLSNVNYSSYRAGSLEFQRSIGRIQYNTIIPVALDRIWARFQRDARERSLIGARVSYEMKWTPPPFESVDPVKEANGNIALMQAGLESRRNLVNARGYDFNTLMAEIAEDTATQKNLGLLFKGDPFNPTQSGSADQVAETRTLLGLLQRLWSDEHAEKPEAS